MVWTSKDRNLLLLVPALIVGIIIGFAAADSSTSILPNIVKNSPSTHLATSSADIQNQVSTEKEPNDSFDQATTIHPGIETLGSLSSGQDTDYYVFSVTEASKVKLSSNNLPKKYDITIYDQDKNQIATVSRYGFLESSSSFLTPSQGKYYIKISTDYTDKNDSPYTITLSISPLAD